MTVPVSPDQIDHLKQLLQALVDATAEDTDAANAADSAHAQLIQAQAAVVARDAESRRTDDIAKARLQDLRDYVDLLTAPEQPARARR